MLEAKAFLELFNVGLSTTVLEQLFADCNNKRLAERSPDLASQQVEELRSSGALNKREVLVHCDLAFTQILIGVLISRVTESQEALNAARGMFRARTIITMREEHDETGLDVPLGLTRRYELINHDLCAVCKVAKLSLPEDKSVRIGLGIPLLKAKHCVLRQMRVRGNKAASAVLF